ncbi:MAG: CPBP family intramembrane metalloprotease [Oscillospiraceae bacterium]|nr:CPBP family intramembrane metalloprotease [Oscillospiraceae bacterium]
MKYKNLSYTYNVIGLAVIMFLSVREVMGLVLRLLSIENGTVPYIAVNMVTFFVACIIPVITMENMLGLHPKLFRRADVKKVAASGAYSYLLLLAAGLANSLILALVATTGLQFAPRTITIPDGTVAVVLYFIHICVLPPLLEEIFLRGYVLNALKPLGTTFAVAVSSVCFSLMHSSLENFLLYFICGIILARVYLTFYSIFASMFVHFVNNTMSFFMLYFQQKVTAVNALSMVAFINVFVLILGFVGIRYLNKTKFRWKKVLAKDGELSSKLLHISKSPIALTAFGMLLFFAAYQSFHNIV